MLEVIVDAAAKAVFGEAFARLIRLILGRSKGASDELLLQLVVETLIRHGKHFDHLEDRIQKFEEVVSRRAPDSAKPLVKSVLHDTRKLVSATSPLAVANGFVVELNGPRQFYRIYYGSVTLGRSSFRGAAPLGDLSQLSGGTMRLDHGTDGIYLRPQPHFPTCVINGLAVRPLQSAFLAIGSHRLSIGKSLELLVTIKRRSASTNV